MSAEEARWMQRALRLAARGQGRTSPNPMVGAVMVQGEAVVGEGYHREVGGPHAEVWALRAAGERARGGTMYVTLEPCSYYGRTPPCADALVQAGLARVVAAMEDPNPRVSGAGLTRLREGGIEVEVGMLEADARRLNAAYVKHTTKGMPLVSLKAAMSLDGKIATAARESRWVTAERARAVGHRLRAVHDAVMVGVGTVLSDDPRLTVRQARGRTPRRVVVDSKGRTPTTAAILKADEIPAIIAVAEGAAHDKIASLRGAGAEVIEVSAREGRVDLRGLMKELAGRGIQSVLVEGGGTLAEGLLAAGLVDRVYFFIAPKIIGGATAPTPVDGAGVAELSEAWRLERVQVRRVGEDILVSGDVAR